MIHTDHSAGYGWQVINTSGEREGFALDLPGSGYQLDFLSWIHEDLADQLAQTVGSTLEGWFEAGKLQPHVSHRLDLSQAAEAMTLLTSRKSTGKVVLTTGSA